MSEENKTTDPGGLFKLEIISGPLSGTSFPILDTNVIIGRTGDADIQIDDTLISRHHCLISYSDGHWFIEDMESTNGTWLVGQRLKDRAFLPFNTPVRVGKTMFEILDAQKESTNYVSNGWKLVSRLSSEEMVNSLELNGIQGNSNQNAMNKLLDALYVFQHTISNIQSETELYPRMLQSLCRIMPDYNIYALTYDVISTEFIIRARGNFDNSPMNELDDLNLELVNFVKESRLSSVFHAEDGSSAVIIPMRGKQQLNGIFYLAGLASRVKDFCQEELHMLSVLGYTAGLAIEYSRSSDNEINNNSEFSTSLVSGDMSIELAHYIKNIMAGLDGCVSLMRLGIDENDRKLAEEAWLIMNKNYQRMNSVVLDMLNVASEPTIEMSVVDFTTITKDIYNSFREQFISENIRLTIENKMNVTPLLVEADSRALTRALYNLVFNAEQAILAKRNSLDDKEPAGDILISYRLNDDKTQLFVSVKDNGLGITDDDARYVFNLFIASQGNAGTGLALAVCKRIIEGHGGRIVALPCEGNGNVFAFDIPVTHTSEFNDTSTCSIKQLRGN